MNKYNIIKGLVVLFAFVISFSVTYTVKKLVTNDNAIEVKTDEPKSNIEKATARVGNKNIAKSELEQTFVDAETNIGATVENHATALNRRAPYMLNVTFGAPKCDYKTLAYNFTVNINNLPPKAEAKFAIYDNIKKDTVANCNDGQFKKVPSNESGMYQLYIQWSDSLGYQGFGIDTLITGFKHFEKPKMVKLEASELERLINKCDRKLSVRNSKISPNMKLDFTNIRVDEKCPETIDEIYNKLKFGLWSSVNVASVEYNDDNQIVLITMTINHSEE